MDQFDTDQQIAALEQIADVDMADNEASPPKADELTNSIVEHMNDKDVGDCDFTTRSLNILSRHRNLIHKEGKNGKSTIHKKVSKVITLFQSFINKSN